MTHLAFDGGQSALRLRVLPTGTTVEGPGHTHGPNTLLSTLNAIHQTATKAGLTPRPPALPGTPAPGPGTPGPGAPALGTPAPGTPAPGTPAPGAPGPGAPGPGAPALGSPALGTPAPGTPAPGTPAPGILALGTPAPGTLAPDTPAPGTLALSTSAFVSTTSGGTSERGSASAGAGGREAVEVVALGLTGFPRDPGVARRLAAGIAEVLQAREVRLTQDMVTAHAGALPDGYGVVVAAGTGLVCLAVDRDGSWHKVDGGGYLFGDAGSAFAIGRAGLAAVQRARDGRGPATVLAETTLDPIALYSSLTLVDDVARFAPEVLRRAAEDDPVAQSIVTGAATDIAATIGTAVGRLAGDDPVPVACVGGLFAGAGDQLTEPLRVLLPSRAHVTEAAGNSLDGAERLATEPPGPYADLLVIHRS